jgi:HlyD family secretion protein
MDLQRDPAILRRKKRRQAIGAGVAAVVVIGLSVAVSRLEPAAPTIANADTTLWYGTVKRGPMVREVRGSGTLTPEEIRWIPASAAGRVDRIVLQPGASVAPGTVILELSNPDLQQNVKNAEMDWKTAVAQLANQRATLANSRLTQEAAVSDAEGAHQVALSDLEMNQRLFDSGGLVPAFVVKQKQVALNQAKNRVELAKKQLASSIETAASQMAPAEATVNQRKAEFDRLSRQLADLHVTSGMTGQLQLINVEVGQQVGLGTNLARVSDPTRLKAEIRISETQTKDLRVGQNADIDTRSGHVKGHVSRIDPASKNGTVGVDVTLDGPLPPGARPDLGVDGTIELERLANVLYMESPSFGQEQSTISVFKVLPAREAVRVPVKVGRRSVQFIEVVEGLAEGDKVILSDMSQYDGYDKVRLN